MKNQVQVIDNLSNEILFSTSFLNIKEAYDYATLLEKEGLDITVKTQGLPETLLRSLSGTEQDIMDYKKSLDDEICDHCLY